MSTGRLRRWARRLARLALFLFAGALALEAGLRGSDWRPNPEFLQNDGVVGRLLVPGTDTQAWGARLVVDEHGLRTAPERRATSPGGPRILFLGGSTTFGYGLDWDETFPARLEAILGERGVAVEVVNGGVPLGDSANRRSFLEHHGERIAPDIVVFAEAINDMASLVSPAHQCYDEGKVSIHYTRPEEERWPIEAYVPQPVPVPSPRTPAWLRSQRDHFLWWGFSQLGPAVRSYLKSHAPFAWVYRRDPEKYQARLRLDPASTGHGHTVYRDNLRAIVAWGRAHGVPTVFVSHPRRGQQDLFALLPDEVAEPTRAALDDLLSGDPAAAVARLEQVTAASPAYLTPRHDLVVALYAAGRDAEARELAEPLLPVQTIVHNLLMSEIAAETGSPIARTELLFQPLRSLDLFQGDGIHPSAAGAEHIAQELARTLEAANLLTRP